MKPAQSIRSAAAAIFLAALWSVGAGSSLGVEIQVDLDPSLDRFGSQIGTIQLYKDDLGWRSAFGIYDTGASVVTWSAIDQASQTPVPIKVPGGAEAEGIGGTLTGDVSEPGEIWVAGMRAFDIMTLDVDLENAAAAFVPGDAAEHGVCEFPRLSLFGRVGGGVGDVLRLEVFTGGGRGGPFAPEFLQPVHAHGPGNAPKPASQPLGIVQLAKMEIRPHERVLSGVGSLVVVAEQAAAYGADQPLVAFDHGTECVGVAG